MLPSQLTSGHFAGYPPQARQIAATHVALLRKLPLGFVPLLLREISTYDWKFPPERLEVNSQLTYLEALQSPALEHLMAGFRGLTLTPRLANLDWAAAPGVFSEELSAHLWATHQIDAFRAAAKQFGDTFHAAHPPDPLPTRRLAMVVIGQGVTEPKRSLFDKLRPQGTYYTRVRAPDGVHLLLQVAAARANKDPLPFAHWYVDGGTGEKPPDPALLSVSYGALEPVRTALLGKLHSMIVTGSGPEALRSALMKMKPADLGLVSEGEAEIVDRFRVSILTEGSGTQVFSTTFVQWTVRELLRRAQPLTILARFVPRRTERSMYEMIADAGQAATLDPAGSLVDADMGAWYTWLNQRRLPGAGQAAFLAWFEDHGEAIAIGPGVQPNREYHGTIGMDQLLLSLA